MSYVETTKTMTGAYRSTFALFALLSLSSLQAGDAGGEAAPKPEPPGETVTVDITATAPPPAPAKETVINDPLFSILAKTKIDASDKAAVIDLGDGPDFAPVVGGKWKLPDEEKAAPGITRGDHRVLSGDPETVRHVPVESEGDSEVSEPAASAARARPFRPLPGDPETRIRNATILPGDVEDSSMSSAAHGARTAAAVDAPRFRAGVGLDSDAAETVAQLINGPQTTEPETPKVDSDSDKPAQKAALDKMRVAMAARKAPAKKGGKGKGKEKEPEDLEKVFQDTIAQVERDRPLIEETLKHEREEREKKVAQFADLHIRDENAALVMDALVNKKPLGTITCKITDRTTKAPAFARVRLTDITDVPIQAPLPQGFWAAGEFSAQAISGIAKIELSRGRFAPNYEQRVKIQKTIPTTIDALVDQIKVYDFPQRGWYVADLDCGVRVRDGEKPVWLGAKPTLGDLCTVAKGEGIHILGVPPPWGEGRDAENPAALERLQSDDLFLLPVLPGPRHAFHGIGAGLGVRSVSDVPLEISTPELPLRDGFDEIRSRGGLAVFKQLNGLRNADIRREIFPLFPRLEETNFFGRDDGNVPLFAANELPFDTVTGPSFDVLAFDGSPECERLWFNLLSHGYPVSVIGASGGSLEGGHVPFGQTLIQLPGKPTRDNVLAAIKQGRTIVTFGPAVFARIAERDMWPGSVLPADGRTLSLQLQAYSSMIPGAELSKVEVIRNGEVIRTHEPNVGETLIHNLSWSVNEVSAAWYVIRLTERYTKSSPADLNGKTATAWTSPIFFRGPSYSPPPPAMSRVSGVLHIGVTPCAGKVKAVVTGQSVREVETDANGRYKIDVSSAGTLIFEAPGADPRALRIFEHPKVQRALGRLQSAGTTKEQFEKPSLFPAWCLLLSELEWDVSLSSRQRSIPAPRLTDDSHVKTQPRSDLPPSHEIRTESEILQPQR